ncbi:MAG: hypothetical protein FWG65_02805 [Turicibacter sp.]|nr:hypothetical protein [Turicibacter sp.]
MELTRYDGTRFITEEEIDREFTGKYALISFEGSKDHWSGGYLRAVAEDSADGYSALCEISILEYEADAKIIYGCKERGVNLHVEFLGWAE